ncbi:MAG: NVEALA domain-containing protein [Phocaeicola sp.]|nr:NVEALA domain-containing protein [Phocaeicola sp.]
MKKRVFKLVFSSAFVLVAGYSVYASQQNAEMSDLALANVEALAGGEEATCTFSHVEKDQATNKLNCSGNGSLCCSM